MLFKFPITRDLMKNDNLKRNDAQPPVISGDFVATQSVVAVTNLSVTGPFRGDFQVIDQGRVIVGEDPDIGSRGILSAKALQGFNANGINTFAVWFATTEAHAPGDFHAGNLAGNFLQYNQADGTLGLYTPDGAGVIMDNDGTFIAGHADHGHMKWDAVTGSFKIMSGDEVMAEVGDDGNAQFTGIITATGGHITERMFVDEVLQAGDVDGPSIYLGRFTRTNDADELVETSEIIATDATNLPWFHVVAGGETSSGGYFHLGGTGDYDQKLHFDGTTLRIDGEISASGGDIAGWQIVGTQLRSASMVLDSAFPYISAGLASSYGTGAGFWLGNDGGTYKFRVGDPLWDRFEYNGVDILLNGNIVGGTLGDINGWAIQEGLLTSEGIGFATVAGNATYALWIGTNDPATANFTVSHAGYIGASAGVVGGWTLGDLDLTSGSGGSRVGLSSNPNFGAYSIYAGNEVPASAPFSVTNQGVIKAVAGSIAGWQFVPASTGLMYAGTGANRVGLDSTGFGPAIYAGSDIPGTAPFRVMNNGAFYASNATISGSITATSGVFGGWTLNAASLTGGDATLHSTGYLLLGTGNNVARIDAVDANYRIWAGNAAAASAPFSVTKTGVLTASSATVSGAINASSGTFSGNVQVGTGVTHIHLDGSQALIESSTFASGSSGWRITASGDAEFGNITARGSLASTSFQYGQVMATNGSIWVVPSSGKTLNTVYTANTPTTFVIDIEDPDGMTHAAAGGLWIAGDIIRIKEPLVGDVWATISSLSDMSSYWRLTVVKNYPYGTHTFPIGAPVLNYKQTGAGNIRMTADETNSPFVSISTHAGTPWSGQTERVRLGNLTGISGLNGYGLYTNFVSSLTDSTLMSHWTMNEAGGSRYDSHGTTTLSDIGGSAYTYSGKIDNAATFYRSSNQYLYAADNAALSFTDEPFTIAGWVRFYNPLVTDYVLFAKSTSAAAAGIEYAVDYNYASGYFRFRVSNGSTFTSVSASSASTIATDTWYYIVAWHDPVANTINIQINNGAVDSQAHSAGCQNGTGLFTVGTGYGSTAYCANAYIDSLSVWRRVLTTDERTTLYGYGAGSDYPFSSSYGGIIAGVGSVGSNFYGVQLRSDGISTWRNNAKEVAINSNGIALRKSPATRMSIGNANDGALVFLSNFSSQSGNVAGMYLYNQSFYGQVINAFTPTTGIGGIGLLVNLETRLGSTYLNDAIQAVVTSGSGITGDYIKAVHGKAVGSGSQGEAIGVYAEFTGSGTGYALYANTTSHIEGKLEVNNALALKDGMTAPAAQSGYAQIYVDSSTGDLMVRFGDGTVKTIVTD